MDYKVLIVDDVDMNRDILCAMLEDEYDVLQAANGKEALDILAKEGENIDVMLLDILMPVMDGFGVLEEMNKTKMQEKIPVIVISGDNFSETEEKCFDYGVVDFVRKPYYKDVVLRRVRNVVELYHQKKVMEEKIEKQTMILRKQNKLLRQQAEIVQKRNVEIIDILGTVVESRNLESGEHVKRVKGFTKILATWLMKLYPEYGLTEERVEMIAAASALHDVGKIAIPDQILLKPGRLTDEEFEYMKSHSLRGCEILNNIKGIWDDDYGQLSYEICRHHHERYDGKGYPDQLVGEDIPIAAQIVSVADVYDALISERVYKSAYTKDEAFHMIVTGECGIFSPKLLECLRQAKDEMEALADAHQEQPEDMMA